MDLFRRINYRHFKQDVFPSKEKIEEILQEAINISPVDKEFFSWRVEVHGPEYAAEKADLVLESGTYYTRDDEGNNIGVYQNYVDEFGKERWDEQIRKAFVRQPGTFNCQIQAPYLLSFITNKTDKGYQPERKHSGMERYRHHMNLGIFLYGITMAANNHEVDAAFCQCYSNYRENAMLKLREGDKVRAFIGLGYYDWSLAGTEGYDAHFLKTDNPDIVRRRTGGIYNIREHTRSGYKTKKPNPEHIVFWK